MAVGTAHRIAVISTLDWASMRNTARVLESLEEAEIPEETLALTLNHVNRLTVLDGSGLSRILQQRIVAEIPYDPRIQRGNATGEPVVSSHPRCEAARAVRELARQLTGLDLPEPAPWYRSLLVAWRLWHRGSTRPLSRSAYAVSAGVRPLARVRWVKRIAIPARRMSRAG